VAFIFRDTHAADAAPLAVQAAFDGISPIADWQEPLRPEVVGEDEIAKRSHDLVPALTSHFLPLGVVVGRVD